jgi:hypothetical protein
MLSLPPKSVRLVCVVEDANPRLLEAVIWTSKLGIHDVLTDCSDG